MHLFLLAPLNNATHKKKKNGGPRRTSLFLSLRDQRHFTLLLSRITFALIVDYLIPLLIHLKIVGIWIYIPTLSIVFFSFLDHCIIELQAKLFLYCLGSFRITALWRLQIEKFIMPIPSLKLSQSALRIAPWDPIFGPSELDVSKVRLITLSLISKSDGQVGFWFRTR